MARKSISSFLATLAFGAVAAMTTSVHAEEGKFNLELNSARDIEGGCRLTYVAMNNIGVDLTKASYEVAIFDKDSVFSRLLILEFGNLPKGKTKVVQFDLAEKPCADISRLLVNSVAECISVDGPYDQCLSGLATTTRADIQFGL